MEKDRKLDINLSNDYSYNSEGYYCSLLAQTRGQKVIPDVDIINKMEAGTGVRMDRSLQALCYQWIQKNDIKDDIWYLNIYFGKEILLCIIELIQGKKMNALDLISGMSIQSHS